MAGLLDCLHSNISQSITTAPSSSQLYQTLFQPRQFKTQSSEEVNVYERGSAPWSECPPLLLLGCCCRCHKVYAPLNFSHVILPFAYY